MSKLGIVLATGACYVLGARAGRERYDQIQRQARRVWSDPRVQKAKGQASDLTQEKANQAQDKLREESEPKPSEPPAASHPNPNDMPAHPATELLK